MNYNIFMGMRLMKGFTLVELVITIVIVGILSLVAVPIYRNYVRRAMGSEASALLGAINNAEKIYFTENAGFYTVGLTSFDETLDIDARANKYFTSFFITYDSASNLCYAITNGNGGASGISATLITDLKD